MICRQSCLPWPEKFFLAFYEKKRYFILRKICMIHSDIKE